MTALVELTDFLFEAVSRDKDLCKNILTDYIDGLSQRKRLELEDFLVNNFGED